MSERKPIRLERRLTRRMIQVQAGALTLFFLLIVFPLAIYPSLSLLGGEHPLAPENTTIFVDALTIDADGAVRIAENPAFAALVEDFPGIWFVASDTDGRSVEFGNVPPYYDRLGPSLWEFETISITPRPGSLVSGMQLNTVQKDTTNWIVASGGGRRIGLGSIISRFWVLLGLGTFTILTLAAWVLVPRIIRSELRGIKSAADQAAHIDIKRRGLQLPTDNVPEEVLALVVAVNEALQRLDISYAQRERFLADSAHELRTPITILQTRLEMTEPFVGQSKLLLDIARLSSLADQLLDLQRLDLTRSRMVQVDLVVLAESAVADLAPLAINAGYELELVAPAVPVNVLGDEGSLTRVLTNLIQNAIVHGGGGGSITVRIEADGCMTVSDEGPGIPAAQRDRVFEPFYRIKPLASGAGLGLNLVASIVQRHNGRIAIDENDGGGARFTITLPLAEEVAMQTEIVV